MSAITHAEEVREEIPIPDLLDEPEQEGLLRLTRLVEHLFRVPAAYVALLGSDLRIDRRIGSGSRYWNNVQTFPLADAFRKRQVWPDPAAPSPPGIDPGDLRFVAAAPLRSHDGVDLGLLVILDVKPHPGFTPADHDALEELAAVLAGKMELRRIALQARESELLSAEAERRFRSIANSAPVMIIYSGVDGSSSFVNKAWLEFTGRMLEDEIGDGFEDRFHPDYRESVMQTYWDAFQERRPLTLEFPMLRHDGEYRWMQARGMPRTLDDGRYAGYIGTFVDMTDQRSAARALRVQTGCTAVIAENARMRYLILDREGRIEQISSPSPPLAAGVKCSRVRGTLIWEAAATFPQERIALNDAVRRVSSGTMSAPVRASGSNWLLTPVVSDKGELDAIVATVVPA